MVAEYEKSMLVLKLQSARARIRRKTGKCEGRKNYTETDIGRAIIKRIRQLREMNNKRPMKPPTFQQIADILNSEGYVNQNGTPFSQYRVQQIYQSHNIE
jgi:hypothetical protein